MSRPTTSIPVNVIKTKQAAPAQLPNPVEPPVTKKPERSLEQKRRLMWWIVGIGTLGAIVIWIWLWPMQMGRLARDTTFDRIANILHLPTKQESAGEKEIRALDKEVFPQFQ